MAVAKVTPEQIASYWAKWNTNPGSHIEKPTGELVDFDGNPLTPEKVEYARAFTRAADAYYATGDMTGFQELGIFPPGGDPAYEELGISSPDSGGG